MSELERITKLSKARTQEGRNNPKRRKDDDYVVDLIYLLEQSIAIISKLSEGKSVVPDDALTIKGLQDILNAIDDDHLEEYFLSKVREALGIKAMPNPLMIKEG